MVIEWATFDFPAFYSRSVVKGTYTALSGEDKTVCPSENSETLSRVLNSLNNDTGKVYHLFIFVLQDLQGYTTP